jgi:Ca-activated chloride channel family protein
VNRYSGLTFVDRGGSEFIPRLWAQRKIGYLLTQIRLKGANAELVQEVKDLATKFGIATPYTSFLVEEPGMQTVRPWATPQPMPGGGFGGGPSAGAAMAPSQDAGGARSGAAAVAKSQSESQMQNAVTAPAAPAGSTLRQVGDKTFVQQNGAWVDTTFDSKKIKPEVIKFGSARYFKLLSERPELARFLALGDRVTVVLESKAYSVEP